MASNANTIRMPLLPTVPLPVNVVSTGMLYMYSCSQCDFKTHIEGMFKQHVDSIHLGITTVSNNIVISNSVATLAAAAMPQTALAGQPQTLVMTTSPVSAGGQTLTGATLAAQPTVVATEPKHKCLKCGFHAPSKNQLAQHKRKFHGKTTAAASAGSQFQQVNLVLAVLSCGCLYTLGTRHTIVVLILMLFFVFLAAEKPRKAAHPSRSAFKSTAFGAMSS